jgi:hypothetical protein
MYWGSASYFIELNNILKEKHHATLMNVVMEYQLCCRLKGRSLATVIESWDGIIGADIAYDLLEEYKVIAAKEIAIKYFPHPDI